jgi:hypothetical protein
LYYQWPQICHTTIDPAGIPDGNGKWQLVNEDEKRPAFKESTGKNNT